MNEFSLFKTFSDIDAANDLIQLLEERKIKFSIINDAFEVDITFTGNKQSNIQILIQQDDFNKVQGYLEAEAENEIIEVDQSHYLYKFTNSELFEILEKKDEWSMYDYVLAKKLLIDRGVNVDSAVLEKLNIKRDSELSAPEKGPSFTVLAGYFFGIAGGLLGILIGWSLWKSKKTLSNGEKVYVYVEEQRANGKIIFYMSFFVLITFLTFRFGH
ncbi:hypothetical protein [Crocinitomix catalasitica]|uniref:hypothetical protein n=1 Tax=Crocinitomix catalasitica TaxID=184607 RepID=UPI000684B871|nr:hypothetical protein [Crocinitomix catalasitica]